MAPIEILKNDILRLTHLADTVASEFMMETYAKERWDEYNVELNAINYLVVWVAEAPWVNALRAQVSGVMLEGLCSALDSFQKSIFDILRSWKEFEREIKRQRQNGGELAGEQYEEFFREEIGPTLQRAAQALKKDWISSSRGTP